MFLRQRMGLEKIGALPAGQMGGMRMSMSEPGRTLGTNRAYLEYHAGCSDWAAESAGIGGADARAFRTSLTPHVNALSFLITGQDARLWPRPVSG
jgi:hypothetical protein